MSKSKLALTVLAAILAATGEKDQGEKEERSTFLGRVAQSIDDLPEAKYDGLPEAARKWAESAAKAINDEKPLPEFPTDAGTEGKAPKAEKPVKEGKALKTGKKSKEPKPEKAAKTGKGKKSKDGKKTVGKKPERSPVRKGRLRDGATKGRLADFRRKAIKGFMSGDGTPFPEFFAAWLKSSGETLSKTAAQAAFWNTRATMKLARDGGFLKDTK